MTLDEIIDKSLSEDIGTGDHTTLACIPHDKQGKAKLLIKENGILCGVNIAEKILKKVDANLDVKILINDGEPIKKNDVALTVEGSAASIVIAERTVLNFMQRMSGIATYTHIMVEQLHGLKTKILDTRKTTPNLRLIEKMAVVSGGGVNHRFGLYDMILIKDNHIDFAGSIALAISTVQKYLKEKNLDLKIEVEARNIEEVNDILAVGGIDRILLDNFSFDDLRKAVKLIDEKYETESSGNVTLENIRQHAECGVDYISVGALTHQIKSLDMSLKAF